MRYMLFDRWGNPLGDLPYAIKAIRTRATDGTDTLDITTIGEINKDERIVFKDSMGRWAEYLCQSTQTARAAGMPVTVAYCTGSIAELSRTYIEDKRNRNANAKACLAKALEGTRWAVGTVETGTITGTADAGSLILYGRNESVYAGSDGSFEIPGTLSGNQSTSVLPLQAQDSAGNLSAPQFALVTRRGTTYNVTVTDDGNGTGTASPATSEAGMEITLRTTPNTGYHFKTWQVVSGGVTITDNRFIMPAGDVTVKAIFEANTVTSEFTVTFDGNGGTPSAGSMTTTGQKLASLPSASRIGSYRFDGWYTAASGGTKITTSTTFSADTTVYAHWTYTGKDDEPDTFYTITVTAGKGGTISPSGSVRVREGGSLALTITPDKGYVVSSVKVDGKSVGAVSSYTFENVKKNHTIEVVFMKASGNPQTGVFVDVPEGSYYEAAVNWAVEKGITTGTDATHFSPDGICTRAQAVTFLWRAAGSPAAKSAVMPFTDVKAGSYYYDAVLWAVANGITNGTTATTCTMAADEA